MKLKLLFLSLIFHINSLLPSIISGTLIKTPNGYKTIENITIGDSLISYNNGLMPTTVTHTSKTFTDTLIIITTQKGKIYVCPDQQFFDPIMQQWIAAKDLTITNTFLDANFNYCACLNVEMIKAPETIIYHLSTMFPHNFFATNQKLLIHNAIPLIIGVAWAFGQGLQFVGVTLGTAILGSYVGVKLYNKQKQKEKELDIVFQTTSGGYAPDPNDDKNNNNFYHHIKLNFHKKFRHNRFGNFYHDPQSKLLWSKDNSGHGGSTFKVFKETSKGLKWIFDADALGNQIIGKHKGPIGIFIPYKELIRCP